MRPPLAFISLLLVSCSESAPRTFTLESPKEVTEFVRVHSLEDSDLRGWEEALEASATLVALGTESGAGSLYISESGPQLQGAFFRVPGVLLAFEMSADFAADDCYGLWSCSEWTKAGLYVGGERLILELNEDSRVVSVWWRDVARNAANNESHVRLF